MKNIYTFFGTLILTTMLTAQVPAGSKAEIKFDIQKLFEFAESQYSKACGSLDPAKGIPRNSYADGSWKQVRLKDWCSGFFAGSLWYIYENSLSEKWLDEARKWTEVLVPLQTYDGNHDLGFMIYCSYGNGYRLTEEEAYKQVILKSSETLATRYRKSAKTILSWGDIHEKDPKKHTVIIDNMMNLEMLEWAAQNGGSEKLDKISRTHANTTMREHIRPDGSTYHVVEYDPNTGEVLEKHTNQGLADESMWARGQTWGIYGFTMMYRMTGDKKYLATAEKLGRRFAERLPEDYVPYWDFDDPRIPDTKRESSAATIAASAFLELYTHTGKIEYYDLAVNLLNELSSDRYLANREKYQCLLLHSNGNVGKNSEVDVNINYADYYYLEALTRLKKLMSGTPQGMCGSEEACLH